MSLRKSPTMTPARLEANRRNAQKSTGPRTARGKAQSRMNGLRTGEYSRVYRNLWINLLDAPPCSVGKTARAILNPELAAHPLFAEAVDLFRQAEIDIAYEHKLMRAWLAECAPSTSAPQQSRDLSTLSTSSNEKEF